jgi:type 1 fimbriae regulatory protein FimB
MAARSSKRRNVKRASAAAADAHERRKHFLTETEVTTLLEAVKAGRHGVRNYLLVLMMYRHGLRVSRATDLRRDEVDLDRSRLWVRRLKNGLSVEQPIPGDELRAIRRYLSLRTDALPWLFLSERGHPLTRQAVNDLLAIAARRAGLAQVRPRCCVIRAGFTSPTAASIFALSRIISVIATLSILFTTHGLLAAGSRTSGVDHV